MRWRRFRAAGLGCRLGKRTLKYIDYGKAAATFYDRYNDRAVRIVARDDSRDKVWQYAEPGMGKYEAQAHAYRRMPTEELFVVQEVAIDIAPEDQPGRPISRIFCEQCGEGINTRREAHVDGQLLCRACAAGAYYHVCEVAEPRIWSPHTFGSSSSCRLAMGWTGGRSG